MELTSNAVERKASQAHLAVDTAAAKANEKAGPAIDRAAEAAHQTVDKVAQAAAPAADWISSRKRLSMVAEATFVTGRWSPLASRSQRVISSAVSRDREFGTSPAPWIHPKQTSRIARRPLLKP